MHPNGDRERGTKGQEIQNLLVAERSCGMNTAKSRESLKSKMVIVPIEEQVLSPAFAYMQLVV